MPTIGEGDNYIVTVNKDTDSRVISVLASNDHSVVVLSENPAPVVVLTGPGSSEYKGFTTPRILIENNLALLPKVPCGDINLNAALVFDDEESFLVTDYYGVTVAAIGGKFYAYFNCEEQVKGMVVVSYMIKA